MRRQTFFIIKTLWLHFKGPFMLSIFINDQYMTVNDARSTDFDAFSHFRHRGRCLESGRDAQGFTCNVNLSINQSTGFSTGVQMTNCT